MAKIEMPKTTSFLDSPATKVGLSFLTGGAAGAGGSTVGALAGLLGKGGGSAPQEVATPGDGQTQDAVSTQDQPSVQSPLSDDSLTRRLAALQADPSAAVHDGIAALSHPDVPPEVVSEVAPFLLQAKHFKMGRA